MGVLDGHGQIEQHIGDADLIDRLGEIASEHMRDIATAMQHTIGRDKKQGCMSFGSDSESGSHLICALCEKKRILAFADERRIDALLPVLQDIFAQ